MRIDLSPSGRLTVDQARRLEALADDVRGYYNAMVSELAQGREDDIDWWVSGIAGRNTYVSSLFLECCHVLLIRDLLVEERLEEISVASKPFRKVCQSLCRDKGILIRIVAKESIFEPLRILIAGILDFCRDILRQLYRCWLCRCKFPAMEASLPPRCTLVELFVLDNSFDKGEFKDRYYENFGGSLTAEERKDHVYLATLAVRLKNLARVVKQMRQGKQRFLIQEELLRWHDFAYAWSYPFRSLFLFPRKTLLGGIDITPILRRAWWRDLFSSRSMEALLKYRFLRRLRESGASIRLIIDWFENQDMDKAANMAYRRYFPGSPVIGYQGFDTQKYWLCAYPTAKEYQCGLLPHTVAVCGQALVEERKRFCQELSVETAPAFRYKNIWKEYKREEDGHPARILVVLPLETGSAKGIVEKLAEVMEYFHGKDITFLLRPHPASRLETICPGSLPASLKIASGDISEYWGNIDVIMGNTSSVLLEAATLGIPVIVVGDLHGITSNPIPDSVPRDIWRMAFTAYEMIQAIELFVSCSSEDKRRFMIIGEKIREQYFQPVTRAAVLRFLRHGAAG